MNIVFILAVACTSETLEQVSQTKLPKTVMVNGLWFSAANQPQPKAYSSKNFKHTTLCYLVVGSSCSRVLSHRLLLG